MLGDIVLLVKQRLFLFPVSPCVPQQCQLFFPLPKFGVGNGLIRKESPIVCESSWVKGGDL